MTRVGGRQPHRGAHPSMRSRPRTNRAARLVIDQRGGNTNSHRKGRVRSRARAPVPKCRFDGQCWRRILRAESASSCLTMTCRGPPAHMPSPAPAPRLVSLCRHLIPALRSRPQRSSASGSFETTSTTTRSSLASPPGGWVRRELAPGRLKNRPNNTTRAWQRKERTARRGSDSRKGMIATAVSRWPMPDLCLPRCVAPVDVNQVRARGR